MFGKCGCGAEVRYSTFDGLGSCNKYQRCLSYEEQASLLKELQTKVNRYEHYLKKITQDTESIHTCKHWADKALHMSKEE